MRSYNGQIVVIVLLLASGLLGCRRAAAPATVARLVAAKAVLDNVIDDEKAVVISSFEFGPDTIGLDTSVRSREYVLQVPDKTRETFVRTLRDRIESSVRMSGGIISGTGTDESGSGEMSGFLIQSQIEDKESYVRVHARWITREGKPRLFLVLVQVDVEP
jgi:hypothetical protein